jgi:beta-D-xylosidase 4
VLLKNLNNARPLSTSEVHTVAVIGPNGNATTTMQGNYFGIACDLVSPLEGSF